MRSPGRAGAFIQVHCPGLPPATCPASSESSAPQAQVQARSVSRAAARCICTRFIELKVDAPRRALRPPRTAPAKGGTRVPNTVPDVRVVASTFRDLLSRQRPGWIRCTIGTGPDTRTARRAGARGPARGRSGARRSLRAGSGPPARKSIEGFSEESMRRLVAHRWPVNIRELRSFVKRRCCGARDDHRNRRGFVRTALGRWRYRW